MKEQKQVTELQALFMRLLPPEEYGEDSNVEECYNRITDIEAENSKLREERKNIITALKERAEYLDDYNDEYFFLESLLSKFEVNDQPEGLAKSQPPAPPE